MNSRYGKFNKKEEGFTASIDTIIERLKKIRALNCEPSDVGMDRYVLKKMSFNKLNILRRM